MKRILTEDEMISHMKEKGISFDLETEDSARAFLSRNNYYMKLSAYRMNYKKYPAGEKRGQYIDLDFAYLIELSKIDMYLRYLVLEMALDIEHFLKVRLLHSIEQNPDEDGYHIIQHFLSRDEKFSMLRKIQAHKSSDYCKGLIEKYYPYFPAWVFVELISFGNLAYLCDFYSKLYGIQIADRILLNSVRDIRNASAHSNCLLNVLTPGNNKAHQSVIQRVKPISGIGKQARSKKLSNKCIYDFVCLLFAYDEIVESSAIKEKRRDALYKLFHGRMLAHKDWFMGNALIVSSYQFTRKVVDYLGQTW